MEVPRYWACARRLVKSPTYGELDLRRWGFSADSLADAQSRADAALEALVLHCTAEEEPFNEPWNYYVRNPPREQVVDEVDGEHTGALAFVTRSRYGSLILNAANAMFIDIDQSAMADAWNRAKSIVSFGLIKSRSQEDVVVDRLNAWVTTHRDRGLRLYRTAAGWRCLVTHRPFDPAGEEAGDAMKAMGCDPRYTMMCRNQHCFRARLTPKPWRCGVTERPAMFPPRDETEAKMAEIWTELYDASATGYATCRMLRTMGNPAIAPALAPLVDYHDRLTAATSNLPLA